MYAEIQPGSLRRLERIADTRVSQLHRHRRRDRQGDTQPNANFSGTWTLGKIEPPPTGRGGIGGGGDESFGAIAQTVVIAQTGRDLTFQSGSMKAVYTLDGNTTVTPPGDVSGLKTRAHWEGAKLHLHYKRGQNWCRDVLSVNGNTLTILRDLESGGGSTTRTITYTKTP